MGEDRIDDAGALIREREARSLTLLLAVALVGSVGLGTYTGLQYTVLRPDLPGTAVALGYFSWNALFSAILLHLIRRRRWVDGIGLLVAFLAATFAAVLGFGLWRGFVADAPPTILTKLPIATAGVMAIAATALTLRPAYAVIAGAGVALTLVGFFALAALHPDTVFGSGTSAAYLGGAISSTRLIIELVFVGSATASTAFAAHFARQTIREAIALQRTTREALKKSST